MKKFIVLVAVFLSLNLYGDPTRDVIRLFSPCPNDEGERKDLSDVLFLKLQQDHRLRIELKREFADSLKNYKDSLMESSATQTVDGKTTQALECSYSAYMQFAYDLISQLSRLGYDVDVIHCIDGSKIHDNRQNLLYCWLEVNLLNKYGNEFFLGSKSEYDQAQAVKNLYQVILPGFCIALGEIKAQKRTV